jgi:hypothetical protein
MVEKASTRNGRAMVLPPQPPAGNRRAATHGAFVQRFTPSELEDIAELEDRIRGLVPLQTPAVEPLVAVLATQLWRYGRLIEYLAEHNVMRGRADRVQLNPAMSAANELEGSILKSLRALALTPKDAASLGLELKRLEQFRDWDFSKLTRAEKATFDELVAKASTCRDGDDVAA